MNKVYGRTIFFQNKLVVTSYEKKLVTLPKKGSIFPCLHLEEKFLFPIRVVNFWKTFCTCSPSSPQLKMAILNVLGGEGFRLL
jgi:hypothetical protein